MTIAASCSHSVSRDRRASDQFAQSLEAFPNRVEQEFRRVTNSLRSILASPHDRRFRDKLRRRSDRNRCMYHWGWDNPTLTIIALAMRLADRVESARI
jgi:hypothetical protein